MSDVFTMKKWWKFVLPIVLAVGLAFWLTDRWKAWFVMPAEPPYFPSEIPERLLLTFADSTGTDRQVSWRCDTVLRPSYVELRSDGGTLQTYPAAGEIFRSRSGTGAYYVGRLNGLSPDRTYSYRVCTGGRMSGWHTFRTPAEEQSRFSFVYVGDIQDTLQGQSNRYLREAFRRHPEAEFLVGGGDWSERPSDNYWAETFRSIDSVGQSLPVMNITGNHDYLKGIPLQLERRFSLIYSYFLRSMEGKNQVFSLKYGDAEFFLLDTNREPNYLWAQRRWLEEKLKDSSARWKILVMHHPIHSIKSGANNLVQKWMFNDLIHKYRVDLVLQGHEHAYARLASTEEDGGKATPVYTISHCSPKQYRVDFDRPFDRIGIAGRYYQKVTVTPDTLFLSAYEAVTGELYDSLLLVKRPEGQPSRVVDAASHLPENMSFTPRPGKGKDADYAANIRRYMASHPEKTFRY